METRWMLWILLLTLAAAAPAAATNLTGTFHHPDGSPVNGKLIFLLSQPARLSDGAAQVVPRVRIFNVVNGALESGAFLYGNDALLPAGTHYLVRLVDAGNNLLFEQKWFIQGEDLNLNTLTPTTIGVALPDPLVKNVLEEQSVDGPVTFTGGLTTYSLTLHGNLLPGSEDIYVLGTPEFTWKAAYLRDLHTKNHPVFDVKAYGAVCDGVADDTTAIKAAIDAANAAPKGGRVYFSGTCLFGDLALTATTNHIVLTGCAHLRPTATLKLLRGYTIDGDCGSPAGDSFNIGAGILISPVPNTVSPVVDISGNGPIRLRNVNIKHFNGTGLKFTAAVWTFLENVTISGTNASSAIPVDIDRSFGFYWDNVTVNAHPSSTSPAITMRASTGSDGTRLFFWRNGQIQWPTGPAIKITPHVGGIQHNYEFTNILYEAGNGPFIQVDLASGQGISGLKIDNLSLADQVGTSHLIETVNGNANLVTDVFIANVTGEAVLDNILQATGGGARLGGWHVFGFGAYNSAKISGLSNLEGFTWHGKGGVAALMGGLATTMITRAGGWAAGASESVILAEGTSGTLPAAANLVGRIYIVYLKSGASSTVTVASSGTIEGASSYVITGAKKSVAFISDGSEWKVLWEQDAVAASTRRAPQFVSTIATGTGPPFTVSSTALVTNLNAQLWGGKKALDFSGTLDFSEIAAQSCGELTISVTGAAANSPVAASWPASLEAGLTGMMRVSAADTVTVRLCNVTGSPVDPTSQTFAGRVLQ